jgi:esterase/lipase superfamily enzyme
MRIVPTGRIAASGLLLAGCASTPVLMPTPNLYLGSLAKPLFATELREAPSLDLLYITNRAPQSDADGKLGYGSDRSRSMAFGSVVVEIGENVSWPSLVEASTQTERSVSLELEISSTTEEGRFPPIPYAVEVVEGGIRRTPAMMDAHERARDALQAEVARRVVAAPRRDVALFVHGYANTFQDSVFTMTDLCHFLGREMTCAIFSWPAGGDRGMMAGYNVDRESGEFSVQHLKQAIRLLANTPGVERIHLLAHSRGTDVLTTALREMSLEAYVGGATIADRFRVKNVVLLAPDIDVDVASAKVFGVVSDPDSPYGGVPRAREVFGAPGIRITAYVSHRDKALTLSQYLFGSLVRFGRLDFAQLTAEQAKRAMGLGYLIDLIEVEGTPGFLGHSYFTSDPAVSADLIALIRYGLRPGEPGRPLEEISAPFWRIPADR